MSAVTICGLRTETIITPTQIQEQLDLNCICGASLSGAAEEWVAREMRLEFTKHHRGKDGHGACSAVKAEEARMLKKSLDRLR